MPISLTGVSCLDDTNKFCDKGILLRILSLWSFLLACFCKINEWSTVVVVPIPTCIVLAEPIWFADWYNAILDILWFAFGITGST